LFFASFGMCELKIYWEKAFFGDYVPESDRGRSDHVVTGTCKK
jgi:hypothetical protein